MKIQIKFFCMFFKKKSLFFLISSSHYHVRQKCKKKVINYEKEHFTHEKKLALFS